MNLIHVAYRGAVGAAITALLMAGLATANAAAQTSTDATLSALSIGGADLSPMFDGAITTYRAEVAYNIARVTVSATTSDPDATVAYTPSNDACCTEGHQVDLSHGDNTIAVKVTSADGEATKTYTVTVNRGPARMTPVITGGTDMTDTTIVVTVDFGLGRSVARFPRSALTVTNGKAEEPRRASADGRWWDVTIWPAHISLGPVEYGANNTRTLTVQVRAGQIDDNAASNTYSREIYDGDLCNGDTDGCSEPPSHDRLCIGIWEASGAAICMQQPESVAHDGTLTVMFWHVRRHILFGPVAGFTPDDITVTFTPDQGNSGAVTAGTDTLYRNQISPGEPRIVDPVSSNSAYHAGYTMRLTLSSGAAGLLTVTVDDGAAHACTNDDCTATDASQTTRGDRLAIRVIPA